jgi:hypothetical protein
MEGEDVVLWSLDKSRGFTVSSLYAKLSEGVGTAVAIDIWKAKIPLKIRIFSWQLILDRLPSSKLIAERNGPASGLCALCGSCEDASHIFFTCPLARFAWSVLRQLLGCRWSPANFAQFFALIANIAGGPRRVIWMLFLAQAWALWTCRNKLVFERRPVKQPADIIFKTLIFFQLWTPLAKEKDKGALEWLGCELRRQHASLLPPRAGPDTS